jgi:Uma2 family endonuclease
MVLTPKGLTLDEFRKLPEEKPALEYWDGVVSQKVSPKARHSQLQGFLTERINGFTDPAGSARAFPELRSTFAGSTVVPDVSVYLAEHIPYDEQGLLIDDFEVAPDIAIEIVSPDQSVNKLIRRCLWYVSNGVKIALLVDPDDESILAFPDGVAPVALRGDDRIDLEEVLPDFELTVGEVFRSLRARRGGSGGS